MNTFYSQLEAASPDPSHDLEWLAFCYLTGELSVEETAAFELRLETDLSAAQALARCVELTATVRAACVRAACDRAASGRVASDRAASRGAGFELAACERELEHSALANSPSLDRPSHLPRTDSPISQPRVASVSSAVYCGSGSHRETEGAGPVARRRVSWQARVSACVVALVLVLSLGWLGSSRPDPLLTGNHSSTLHREGAILDAQGQDIGQVVSLWRQSSSLARVEGISAGQALVSEPQQVVAEELVDDEDDLDDSTSEQVAVTGAHVRVPSWLLAAVSRETGSRDIEAGKRARLQID